MGLAVKFAVKGFYGIPNHEVKSHCCQIFWELTAKRSHLVGRETGRAYCYQCMIYYVQRWCMCDQKGEFSMATQEERLFVVEQTVASLRHDFLQAIGENTHSMSTLNKVV